MVNNLIESDDNLELVDTSLKVPDVVQESKPHQTVVTHYQSTIENKDGKS